MNHPIPQLSADADTTLNTRSIPGLVRRLGDLEVPAPGIWPVVPTSHFAIGRDRPDHPIPLRILGGSLEIDERPERSTLRAVLAGPDVVTFVGQPTSVEPDRHGLSVWRIAGTLVHGDDADPMRFTVAYHGVFRSRGRAWAWFSGSGALETSGRRSWWRRAPRVDRRLVVLELLLDTPRRFAPSEV